MRDFRNMEPGEAPFMQNGLTVDEICRLWRECKHTHEQLVRISQLCGTTVREIKALLRQRGYDVPGGDGVSSGRVRNNKDLLELYGEEYDALVEKVRKMAETLTMEETVREIGCGRHNMRKLANQHGIVFRTALERQAIKRNALLERCRYLGEERNMSAEEIAREIGRTKECVWKLASIYHFGYRHTQKGRKNKDGL